MRTFLYDLFMMLGAGLVVGGCSVAWGLSGGLIASGAAVLTLTRLAVFGIR